MSFEVALHRALRSSLFAGLACALASCGSTPQKMDLTPEMINTPPHRMSRSEYPFDASGRYVDAWAAEGATRYGRFINTDRSEDGRSDTPEPERRPLPPPPPLAATRPPSASVVSTVTTRPPATARPDSPNARPPQPANSQRTAVATNSRSTQTSASKPSTKAASTKTAATKTKASSTKPASSKPAASKTTAKKAAPKKKPTSHTVGRGDSLSSLSRRYGVSIQAIKKANNLKSDRIIDGRKLVIPKS
jgi:LysM repeat protein